MAYQIINAGALDHLRTMPDNSVDAVITDPPYGLSNIKPAMIAQALTEWVRGDDELVPEGRGFMGKAWDGFVPPPAVWKECYRVLKPGGHMAVFAGARTQDLMGLSIRLAGFEIRDTLGWVYGSGFPKSHDIGKAIDKRGGNAHLAKEIGKAIQEARESRGLTKGWCDEHFCGGTTNWSWFEGRPAGIRPPSVETFSAIVNEWPELAPHAEKVAEVEREVVGKYQSGLHTVPSGVGGHGEGGEVTTSHSDAAKQWDGWGTALKPAIEPIILARKPLDGTVANNVLAHGVGGLNIDACRVEATDSQLAEKYASVQNAPPRRNNVFGEDSRDRAGAAPHSAGRFPANVLLDEHAAKEMDEQSGNVNGVIGMKKVSGGHNFNVGEHTPQQFPKSSERVKDSGGASRFFPVFKYQAKAPKKERPVIVREDGSKIQHPTVKPVALMEWLTTLITPPGGTVIDPFTGTGTTIQAAEQNGFNSIGIEREPEYVQLVNKRLADAGLLSCEEAGA